MNTSTTAVKEAFAEHGVTVREWSQANGFSESLVHAVLNGKNKASRGESYWIAVALELKKPPEIDKAPAFLHSVLLKHPFYLTSSVLNTATSPQDLRPLTT